MSKNAREVFESLPKSRQKKIEKKAATLISEYHTLQEFRRSIGITQLEVAEDLNISQVNISKLEKRSDMHISTLRKYVEALGCKLEIKVRKPDNEEVMINAIN